MAKYRWISIYLLIISLSLLFLVISFFRFLFFFCLAFVDLQFLVFFCFVIVVVFFVLDIFFLSLLLLLILLFSYFFVVFLLFSFALFCVVYLFTCMCFVCAPSIKVYLYQFLFTLSFLKEISRLLFFMYSSVSAFYADSNCYSSLSLALSSLPFYFTFDILHFFFEFVYWSLFSIARSFWTFFPIAPLLFSCFFALLRPFFFLSFPFFIPLFHRPL